MSKKGECHRYAPKPFVTIDGGYGHIGVCAESVVFWPIIDEFTPACGDGSCGTSGLPDTCSDCIYFYEVPCAD